MASRGVGDTAAAPVVEALGISVTFGEVLALDDVSFSLQAGEIAVVEGVSGSGKSTLLRALATLEPVARGVLRLGGVAASELAPSLYRAAVAYIAQQPVMFEGSVAQNLSAGPLLRGAAVGDARVADLLEQVGLPATFAKRNARDLSGGEKQRVAIARALANDPRVLLFDEPTSALDPAAGEGIVALVRACADRDRAVLVVTHSREHARSLAGSCYLCAGGKLSRVT